MVSFSFPSRMWCPATPRNTTAMATTATRRQGTFQISLHKLIGGMARVVLLVMANSNNLQHMPSRESADCDYTPHRFKKQSDILSSENVD